MASYIELHKLEPGVGLALRPRVAVLLLQCFGRPKIRRRRVRQGWAGGRVVRR